MIQPEERRKLKLFLLLETLQNRVHDYIAFQAQVGRVAPRAPSGGNPRPGARGATRPTISSSEDSTTTKTNGGKYAAAKRRQKVTNSKRRGLNQNDSLTHSGVRRPRAADAFFADSL